MDGSVPPWPQQGSASEVADGPSRSPWAELDGAFHAWQGRLTHGASPLSLWLAAADWAAHLANSPFRRAELAIDATLGGWRICEAIGGPGRPAEPGDHRFGDPAWDAFPFRLYREAFLQGQDWATKAAGGLPGMSPANERLLRFAARQWLDTLSPSNFPWANPEIIAATRQRKGGNLLDGAQALRNDLGRAALGGAGAASGLEVGRDLAVSQGEVVFRNQLFELIQYAPRTETVHPEPVLIVPAWIMKYYILDLSPHNSMVRFLVESGYTVFCMSWRNPDAAMQDVGFDDYLEQGLFAALEAVEAVRPGARIHAAGYCLGGTLLSVGAAAMARDGDARLASLTLFCAQTDFTDAGELQTFTTEDQVAFLEELMSAQGYLEGDQMGEAFKHLRARDLIWSSMVKSYWLGEASQPNDLMTWNADATRMPARMHSEYLRRFFLHNDLVEGRFEARGRPVALTDIQAPMFLVGTETDHVAPWRSVYKAHLFTRSAITFVLASGGHNVGVVSEPGHPRRHYNIRTHQPDAAFIGPDDWLRLAERREGSWWLAWRDWLDRRSGEMAEPPPMGGASAATLGPAPGTYVFQR